MKRIYVVGQLPPPIHGLSKALDILINSKVINEKYSVEALDIKNNKKILLHINRLIKSRTDLYYFTISQTLFGNLRDMLLLLILLKKKKKIIIHYHGGYYKKLFGKMSIIQKFINKRLISQIDVMIALGDSLKVIFEDVIKMEKIKVCENFVEDTSLIEKSQFNFKYIQVKEKKQLEILYLSNFIETKGYKDVLEAAKLLKDNPNIIFHFAGAFYSKREKDEFDKFISRHDINATVKYYGIVKGVEKKNLLEKCDIFVLPTYYPNEGQPISIIEAMGNGLGVISTNHAGIPDILSEKNGFIVNKQSPQEIANQILRLYSNRKLLQCVISMNREMVMEKYREVNYIERLNTIFNEVMEK
ncbi:glycosyltransferase family 4 protein [Priestia megaterium]|uniref:glycosyltransferase family 4 protein n=1 Tax=Priestia megaterium TaxID=1404 RepID=UPI001BE7A3D4|nr:glycosyltransferase family 4 protein [Priestia megaterium]MBT2257839.1 glycosyltransferase family 4 protein [Priestia megaterium]MBT2277768.1 glycosyltransferase family 4 protein [Priestia megaterium]